MYLCKLNNYCHELALKQPCAYVHITSINKVISTKTGAYYIILLLSPCMECCRVTKVVYVP